MPSKQSSDEVDFMEKMGKNSEEAINRFFRSLAESKFGILCEVKFIGVTFIVRISMCLKLTGNLYFRLKTAQLVLGQCSFLE